MTAAPQLPGPGTRLRQLRLAARMTCEQFAHVTGFSQATLAYFEAGRITPSPKQLEAIAKALKVDLQWLTTGELSPNAPQPKVVRTYPPGFPKPGEAAAAIAYLETEDHPSFAEMVKVIRRAKGKKK